MECHGKCEFCSWLEEGGSVRGKGISKARLSRNITLWNLGDNWRRFQYGAVYGGKNEFDNLVRICKLQ